MSFERPVGPSPEPAPVPTSATGVADAGTAATPALRLQVLATEHWSLLASRNLAWSESFARAGMFLSTLSGAIVALALVGPATDFGEGFRIFALVVLPVVLLVGIGTNLRLGMSNFHDAVCVTGMNRIRAAYLEVVPDVERYLVMGATDDDRGILMTMAIPPRTSTAVLMLASTPLLVSTLNAILAGGIAGLAAIQLGATTGITVLVALLFFFVALAAWTWYGSREIAKARAERRAPAFPSRPEA